MESSCVVITKNWKQLAANAAAGDETAKNALLAQYEACCDNKRVRIGDAPKIQPARQALSRNARKTLENYVIEVAGKTNDMDVIFTIYQKGSPKASALAQSALGW